MFPNYITFCLKMVYGVISFDEWQPHACGLKGSKVQWVVTRIIWDSQCKIGD